MYFFERFMLRNLAMQSTRMKYWQETNDTAVLKFYGQISQWWNGADDFTNTLQEIEGKYKKLKIRLHCYGGEVFEGNVIFNACASSKLEITYYVDGVAASMGSIIMLSGKRVVMAANAFVMIHVPRGYTSGNANDHFATGKVLKAMQVNFAKAYSKKTGKSITDIEAWFDGTDHWFDSQECRDMKLADEISDAVDTATDISGKPDNGVTMKSVYERYAALAKGNSLPLNNNKNRTMDKATIITKFGLTSVTAESSDTAVLDALTAVFTNKDTRIGQLETQQKEVVKTTASAMIAAREKELNTKFTEKQKTDFTAVAEAAGISTLTTVLEAMKAVPVIASMIGADGLKPEAAGTDVRANWTLDQWQEKDPDGLDKLTDEAKDKLYQAKYKG